VCSAARDCWGVHEDVRIDQGAFLALHKDADQIHPGWNGKLGSVGESSVQSATFDSMKKAAAAAILGNFFMPNIRRPPPIAGQMWATFILALPITGRAMR
jgi:hypothetical protein